MSDQVPEMTEAVDDFHNWLFFREQQTKIDRQKAKVIRRDQRVRDIEEIIRDSDSIREAAMKIDKVKYPEAWKGDFPVPDEVSTFEFDNSKWAQGYRAGYEAGLSR